MDSHLLAGLSHFKLDAGKLRRDDDFADRLSHTFTSLLLVTCTLVISARQYIGKPIACWVPTEFTRAQEEYAESVCWVSSTFFVRPNLRHIPTKFEERQQNRIMYYQWVPFMLMLQALLFNLPCIVWRLFNWQSGVNLANIIDESCDINNTKDRELRQQSIFFVSRNIIDSLSLHRHANDTFHFTAATAIPNKSADTASTAAEKSQSSQKQAGLSSSTTSMLTQRRRPPGANKNTNGSSYSVGAATASANHHPSQMNKATLICSQCMAKHCCLWFGKRYGNFVVSIYLLCKLLYMSNVIGQFFIMNWFLDSNYVFYGLQLARQLARGHLWQQSGNFPRITICDFEVRKMGGNIHRHTIQCVLPINMFNEKIFIFLWFWFAFVAAITAASLGYWLFRCAMPSSRLQFVRKFLRWRGVTTSSGFGGGSSGANRAETATIEKKRSADFVDFYLRQDGVFLMRLVAQNSSELVAAELIESLWRVFREQTKMAQMGTTTAPTGGGGGGRDFVEPPAFSAAVHGSQQHQHYHSNMTVAGESGRANRKSNNTTAATGSTNKKLRRRQVNSSSAERNAAAAAQPPQPPPPPIPVSSSFSSKVKYRHPSPHASALIGTAPPPPPPPPPPLPSAMMHNNLSANNTTRPHEHEHESVDSMTAAGGVGGGGGVAASGGGSSQEMCRIISPGKSLPSRISEDDPGEYV